MMRLRAVALAAFMTTSSMSITAISAEPPRETIVSSQKQPIPNIAGKNFVASVVNYQPGAKSPPHRHPDANLIYAHVLPGAIRSQVDDEPAKVYRPGEGWFEFPGAHHKVSENASAVEPAQLLVIFVIDAASRTLIVPDRN